MTRQELAVLICKTIALWLFAQVAIMSVGVVFVFVALVGILLGARDPSDGWISFLFTGAPAVIALSVGLVLWFKAEAIAGRMVKNDPAPIFTGGVDYELALRIALIAVGMYLLIPSLKDLSAACFQVAIADYPVSEWWGDSDWRAYLFADLISFFLSLWLILGSKGVARLIRMARGPGYGPTGQDSQG